jgi:hypothetical protein
MPDQGKYEQDRDQIRASLETGIWAEFGDPNLSPIVRSLTGEQVDWVSSWLAGDGFGKREVGSAAEGIVEINGKEFTSAALRAAADLADLAGRVSITSIEPNPDGHDIQPTRGQLMLPDGRVIDLDEESTHLTGKGDMEEERYPEEDLGGESDDGTMPENVEKLREAVVGHKIVRAYVDDTAPDLMDWFTTGNPLVLELDNGRKVELRDTSDCCAYTELREFLLHADQIDHAILGVGTTDGYETWHVYADMGDVLELRVDWSCGNPFYYGYGFNISVVDPPERIRLEA